MTKRTTILSRSKEVHASPASPRKRAFLLLFAALVMMCTACKSQAPSEASSPSAQPPSTPPPQTMKAVRLHAFTGIDDLRYEDAPRPRPKPGEILIRVHAAAVNPVDIAVAAGRMQERIPSTLPLILGWDVSGVVEEIGEGATRFQRGDAVFAYLSGGRDGAFAEYVTANEADVLPKPKTVDHVHAAAIPLTGVTAWKSLVETANLSAGQTVLIHGGSGGVGTMAVQIAKARGARVIATASAKNLEHLRSIGADQVIDYQATRFEDVVKDVDVVLDTVGKDTQERSYKVLKKGGLLVVIVGKPSPEKAQEFGVRAVRVGAGPNAAQLAEVARLVDEGRIRPVVSEIFPLQDTRRALEQIKTGHTRGKAVIRVVD
ncbi:NADP-dependent oxidoreductase [Polyangium sp. 6x1]|uniref:NADP-dependent oxidoreductase n=1 Tax=Polyangium sp. 6x1 TaxID=3042689 RepID=UPI002482F6CF|nr:NADP-dependent oxidoreductase [Polyangium sp. 6x1]MDI1443034.1 NADP-dependent oxidoreductase [Polyangium sp. 6x1]